MQEEQQLEKRCLSLYCTHMDLIVQTVIDWMPQEEPTKVNHQQLLSAPLSTLLHSIMAMYLFYYTILYTKGLHSACAPPFI